LLHNSTLEVSYWALLGSELSVHFQNPLILLLWCQGQPWWSCRQRG